MLASDLAVSVGLVPVSGSVLSAVRRMVDESLAGLVVVTDDGQPLAVIPASQVVGLAVPTYIKDDPALAAVVDESMADHMGQRLAGLTLSDVLDDAEPDVLVTVKSKATVLEVAAVMARRRIPVVVVVDAAGRAVGSISARDVLRAVTSAS